MRVFKRHGKWNYDFRYKNKRYRKGVSELKEMQKIMAMKSIVY